MAVPNLCSTRLLGLYKLNERFRLHKSENFSGEFYFHLFVQLQNKFSVWRTLPSFGLSQTNKHEKNFKA